MSYSIENITVELVIKSLNDDFDETERNQILDVLKNDTIKDESLLGLKLLLDDNNWEFETVLEELDNLELKINLLAKQKKKSKFTYYKYAAIIIPFIFLVGYTFFRKKSNINNYYIAEKGLPNLMSSDDAGNLDELMALFRNDEVEKAYDLSQLLFETHSENDTVLYFKAVLAYETNRFQESRVSFETILDNFKDSHFFYDASFRVGFALYKGGFFQESKRHFENISNQLDNPFAEDSKKILKEFF